MNPRKYVSNFHFIVGKNLSGAAVPPYRIKVGLRCCATSQEKRFSAKAEIVNRLQQF